ncbi:related to Aspartic proteinase yapsin-7 [Zygosaccharomyces bailii]|nr:related to Aspartic proteinase yapsin-7 [Zygosaccharomyces bailii]
MRLPTGVWLVVILCLPCMADKGWYPGKQSPKNNKGAVRGDFIQSGENEQAAAGTSLGAKTLYEDNRSLKRRANTKRQRASSSTSSSASTSSSSTQLVFPTLAVGKDNSSLYYTNVSLGTPDQLQPLQIDIVEPYIWVISKDTRVQDNSSFNYTNFYTANASSTSEPENDSHLYHLDFVDSGAINGTAVMDILSFESISMNNQTVNSVNSSSNSNIWAKFTSKELTISNVSFFDTNDSTSSRGCIGLGGRITDDGVDINSGNFDDTFFYLETLRDAGIMKSSSYSLWLGGDVRPYYQMGRPDVADEVDCGKLIFGGVDPQYYYGPLKKFQKLSFLDRKTNALSEGYPVLPMGAIYVASDTGKSINVTAETFLAPVLLDSRYVFSYLPAEAIIQIAVQIGAIYVKELDRFLVSCSIASMGVSINFAFGDLLVTIPLQDFLMSTYNSHLNTTLHFSGGDEACFVTIVSNEEIGYNILGGSFLRNVYMAVDHEGGSIAIAKARRIQTTTVTILSDSDTVTSATTYLSPSLSTSREAKAITSGHIPYASLTNETIPITLSPSGTPSRQTAIPDQFTATIFSDGLISTGRSFYNTYRSTTSTRTAPTEFESFSVTSTQSRSSNGVAKNYAGWRVKSQSLTMNYWIPHIFSLVLAFLSLTLG